MKQNNSADQTARMCRLICTFVVRMLITKSDFLEVRAHVISVSIIRIVLLEQNVTINSPLTYNMLNLCCTKMLFLMHKARFLHMFC